MSSTAPSRVPFFDAIKARRSIYALTSESPISASEIQELVKATMLHVPSSFNSQTARVVLLLGAEHKKFWDMVGEEHKKAAEVGEGRDGDKWKRTKPRIDSILSAHGTALFYEDSDLVSEYASKFPAYSSVFPDWSLQSSGMHQFTLWTALDAAGLGANLQHYQIVESVVTRAAEMYKVPESWSMQAQLVFGGVAEGGKPTESKPKKSTDETVKVFGA